MAVNLRAIMRLRRRFHHDTRGVTAIEFSLIAVPFFGLLMAIIELGLRFLINSNLDAAVRQASRAILTGAAQTSGVTTADQFRTTYLCPATGPSILNSIIDCRKLIIDVRASSTFGGANISNDFYKNQAGNTFCPGSSNAITILRVAYPMPSYLPILALGTGGGIGVNTTGLVNDVPNNPGWKHLLIATSAMQVENFHSAQYTPPSGC